MFKCRFLLEMNWQKQRGRQAAMPWNIDIASVELYFIVLFSFCNSYYTKISTMALCNFFFIRRLSFPRMQYQSETLNHQHPSAKCHSHSLPSIHGTGDYSAKSHRSDGRHSDLAIFFRHSVMTYWLEEEENDDCTK